MQFGVLYLFVSEFVMLVIKYINKIILDLCIVSSFFLEVKSCSIFDKRRYQCGSGASCAMRYDLKERKNMPKCGCGSWFSTAKLEYDIKTKSCKSKRSIIVLQILCRH